MMMTTSVSRNDLTVMYLSFIQRKKSSHAEHTYFLLYVYCFVAILEGSTVLQYIGPTPTLTTFAITFLRRCKSP